jgi:hypothetical protein
VRSDRNIAQRPPAWADIERLLRDARLDQADRQRAFRGDGRRYGQSTEHGERDSDGEPSMAHASGQAR